MDRGGDGSGGDNNSTLSKPESGAGSSNSSSFTANSTADAGSSKNSEGASSYLLVYGLIAGAGASALCVAAYLYAQQRRLGKHLAKIHVDQSTKDPLIV